MNEEIAFRDYMIVGEYKNLSLRQLCSFVSCRRIGANSLFVDVVTVRGLEHQAGVFVHLSPVDEDTKLYRSLGELCRRLAGRNSRPKS